MKNEKKIGKWERFAFSFSLWFLCSFRFLFCVSFSFLLQRKRKSTRTISNNKGVVLTLKKTQTDQRSFLFFLLFFFLTLFSEDLNKYNNFNSLFAVASALSSSPISRLKWTRSEAPEKLQQVFISFCSPVLFLSSSFRLFFFSSLFLSFSVYFFFPFLPFYPVLQDQDSNGQDLKHPKNFKRFCLLPFLPFYRFFFFVLFSFLFFLSYVFSFSRSGMQFQNF